MSGVIVRYQPRRSDGTPITSQRKFTFGQRKFLRTTDGSGQMNVDGTTSSSEVMWNGTGASDTGGDWTHESQGSEQTAAKKSGTNGLDSGICLIGQETVFNYESNRDIESLFDSVSFWMMPKNYPPGTELKTYWKSLSGGIKGTKLNVANYVANLDLDTWSKVTIPISDFNLNSNEVSKLVLNYTKKNNQRFYFDDFDLTDSSGNGPYTYRVEVDGYDGYSYHVSTVNIVISASNTGWDSNCFANLSSLENGIILRHRRLSTSDILWSISMRDNVDLFGNVTSVQEFNFGDDEIVIVLSLEIEPATVVITDDDVLEMVIRDDLSSLDNMRAYVKYGIDEQGDGG
jgi:hypothetical protein